jgi:hypothetical protein
MLPAQSARSVSSARSRSHASMGQQQMSSEDVDNPEYHTPPEEMPAQN